MLNLDGGCYLSMGGRIPPHPPYNLSAAFTHSATLPTISIRHVLWCSVSVPVTVSVSLWFCASVARALVCCSRPIYTAPIPYVTSAVHEFGDVVKYKLSAFFRNLCNLCISACELLLISCMHSLC